MSRGRIRRWECAAICLLAGSLFPAAASDVVFHGRVTLEDGSPPPKPVSIERVCADMETPRGEALTNRKGEYIWRVEISGTTLMTFNRSCLLRVSTSAYYSTSIDVSEMNWFSNPILPDLVLLKKSGQTGMDVFAQASVPRAASRAWQRATAAVQARNWSDADLQLRVAVKAAPNFAAGWHALGIAAEQVGDAGRARDAQRRAVELNPKLVSALVMLARLDLDARDWPAALKTTAALIAADPKKRYPEAQLLRAMAQYYSQQLDEAEASATACIRADVNHELPRAEIVLGLILETKHNLEASREHLNRYLAEAPRASDVDFVRDRLNHLGETRRPGEDGMKEVMARIQPSAATDAWVPGGMKALAAVSLTRGELRAADFFGTYCETLVREGSPGLTSGIPGYRARLGVYMAAMAELSRMGERKDGKTRITLSLDDAHRRETERVLTLLGWKLDKSSVEIGDQPGDSPRQDIAAALGIDGITMQEALEAGRAVPIEISSDTARLIGGDAWGLLVKDLPSYPGGIADALAHDFRLARACAGLYAMSAEASAAVLSGIGLSTLVQKLHEPLARYGAAFALSGDRVATPGAEETWQKLAGASPRKPAAFFKAVLERDLGALAGFYFALSRADAAHQRYFTATPQRAERFYAWYRDSGEPRWSLVVDQERWRSRLFQALPLDESGNLRFPGGRAAWSDAASVDEAALLKLPALQALIHAAELEQRLGIRLEEKSARLLAQHDQQWQPLLPYLEQFRAVAPADLEALAAFTGRVSQLAGDQRDAALGEWYALVELVSRGMKSGALDRNAAQTAFRRACESLGGADHGSKAVALARELGGANLLRLTPERRAAYDRVVAEQNIPRLEDPAKAAAALSGMIYAATLDAAGLLAGWDAALAAKHRFAVDAALFAPSSLERSNQPPGSRFTGGFSGFAEIASGLARARGRAEEILAPTSAGEGGPATTQAESDAVPADAVFRASGRLVEVFATVTDSRGRYLDDLRADQFSVLEQGNAQAIRGFESRSTEVSVALLLDTTASMEAALPSVKNAALKLISELRPADSVAVYSFNERVTELQPFTTDQEAAKRAIIRTSPMGETALYDALARVNRDLAGRTGKKVIVVFTDGDDNSSTLTALTAIQRTKGAGIPVYTIAEGAALIKRELLAELAEVSRATGGRDFVIHNTGEVRGVFEKISQDLQHGYFFLFQPAAAEDHAWRSIEVKIRAPGGLKIRAREGYYPE